MVNWCHFVESIDKNIQLVDPVHTIFNISATLWPVAGDGVHPTPDFDV